MASKKVAILGSGVVGEVLANGFLKHGFDVMRASRDVNKLQDWRKSASSPVQIGTFEEGAAFGEIVVLAVKGTAVESIVKSCTALLKGKTVIDATNPIAEAPPVNGVLRFFSDINLSLMERLQKISPEAHFVKAFSCVGSAFMVNPKFSQGKPTMFICGNNEKAKMVVGEVLSQFGWDTEDMGIAEASRAIERACMR